MRHPSISCFSRPLFVAASIALLSTSGVLAQTVTGSITGTVTDPSGAVVPGAEVVAVNTATGVRTPVKSNDCRRVHDPVSADRTVYVSK